MQLPGNKFTLRIRCLTAAVFVILPVTLMAFEPPLSSLPDAPQPQTRGAETPQSHPRQDKPPVTLHDCPYDKTHAPECSVRWKPLLISSGVFLAWQNAANVYSSYWYRYETTHGNWWDRYTNSVLEYKYSVWSDGNPYLDDYIGHPLMGAITDFLWIQNDPKGTTLEFSNTRPYWISRLRALGYSAAYSTQWKLGPFGESGIGHQGDHLAYDRGHTRNETGFVSLVTTPVGGTLWAIAEDVLDKKVIRQLERRNSNPFLLLTYSFLNPARGTANMLRFRPPWYRDYRTVKADSFWSDPEEDATAPPTHSTHLAQPTKIAEQAPVEPRRQEAETVSNLPDRAATSSFHRPLTIDISPGGTHELGAWWGLSLASGTLWGEVPDVKYMPIDVRYSYRFFLHEHWALRYSPEITALAMIDAPDPQGAAPFNLRKRTYGSGLSPEGIQVDFRPRHRFQPFLSHDAGFIYFADRVLSPQGSQMMYTIDFGGGVNFFHKARQAVTLGYRYQHLTNGNIGAVHASTDANTFYVGVSRFRSREN